MRLALAAAALAVAFVSPAHAQQACATISIEQLQSVVEEAGGEFIGGAAYDGANSDLALIYVANGIVWLVAFKDGCAVGAGPLALDEIAASAPSPQYHSPALKSPKAEVGA